MKRLLLMRHAKSDWNAGAETDFDRPLNYRGRNDATKMAIHLIQENIIPELVLFSSSARTTETWSRMNKVFVEDSYSIKSIATLDLYHGGLGQIQSIITALPTADQDCQTILALGHNPGWNNAVSWLTGIDLRVTTANIIVLEHSGSIWGDVIRDSNWLIKAHFQPKTL